MTSATPIRSLRRTAALARWNVVLLTRNRLALFYAALMPLVPLALLLTGERGSPSVGASAMTTVFLVLALFPVYYNVLSQFVSRRDELVLKRLRTGESRDGELLASVALPGALSALVLSVAVVPIAAAFGQSPPLNPVLYVVLSLVTVAMFTAFAFWTAAWTRSAEAAQLTSLPIILVASAGPLTNTIPDMSEPLRVALSLTPGAAMSDLVRIGWFGLDGPDATETTLTASETWLPAVRPLLVMVGWTGVAVGLARRSMRWEPRT